MRIMLANNSGGYVHYLAGRFPDLVGHLYSPGGVKGPYWWIPYALDNGAFTGFQSQAFGRLLETIERADISPLWSLVPDKVGDPAVTLQRWESWVPQMQRYGWPLAFAVQDGMTAADVPGDAEVVFVGGSTTWKEQTLTYWPKHFERCHLGRVNHWHRLWNAHRNGYESVDGTGWLRGGPKASNGQWVILTDYLERMADGRAAPHAWQLDHTEAP